MGYKVPSEFKLREVHRENKRTHEKSQADRHASDVETDDEKGSRASGISNASGIGLNITRKVTRVRFRSCGTVGYGPTLNKKGGDNQCDQVARYVREQLVSYVGNNVGTRGEGQREPFFCSLRRGGPIRKVLVHRWVPKVINNGNRAS